MIVVYGDGHGCQVPDDYMLQESDGPKSALLDEATWYWYAQTEYGVGFEVKYHKFIPLVEIDYIKGRIEAEKEIWDMQDYLEDTDYIITKIQEAMIYSMEEAESLKQEYSVELAKRIEYRRRINELQEQYDL